MNIQPCPLHFDIQGKQFAGELWGETGKTPLIALHGWLDNCHSFSLLAPLLKNFQVLALDMAGHGHSDHRSADASYHIWDDVREVLMIANEMGWQSFVLMGHSRGAIISCLIAATAPQRVTQMILIEGFWPQTMAANEAPQQLAKFIDSYMSFDGISRGYKAIEPMVQSRHVAGFGMSMEAARILVARNTEFIDSHFYWKTDRRLTMPSPVMFTDDVADSFLSGIKCKTLLIIAKNGLGKRFDFLRAKLEAQTDISVTILEGGHHLHLEEPVVAVARLIEDFLDTPGE